MTIIKNTPWGIPEHITELPHGICFVSTMSHGGYIVPRKLAEEKIPAWILTRNFVERSRPGFSEKFYYFEEDCDWCVVAIYFPELFGAPYAAGSIEAALKDARRAFDFHYLETHK